MPFEKNKKGVTTWRAPENKEVARNRTEILESDVTQPFQLPKDMQSKLASALSSQNTMHGVGALVAANSKIYNIVENILVSAPGLVDVVIPVHNSIHLARKCIQAVLDRTIWPFHITLVDDASDQYTHYELVRIAEENKKHVSLITNKKNRGFAATVNRGIKETNGEYVCLLNSDVLVTKRWLTKMVMAQKADERNMIVCPATNNTAIVNIPLSEGASYLSMNRVFETYSIRSYPEIMPTGFCFLFPRFLLRKVGLFDEAYISYGEESDWWMRVRSHVDGDNYPRWRAVLAEDTYVFHERGTSFSALGEQEMGFRKSGSSRFHKKWPEYAAWERSYSVKKEVGHLRHPVPTSFINQSKVPYRICWVVHSADMCGGMKLIADIVNEINERGGDARVAVIKRKQDDPVPVLPELRAGPVVFNSYQDFIQRFPNKVFKNGFVVASTAEQAACVYELTNLNVDLKPILHVQSFEPKLVTDPKMIEQINKAFTLIPDVISSSGWVTDELKKLGITPMATVPPGVDTDLFYPRGRDEGDERPTLMVCMNKQYKFKGFDRGLKLIHNVEQLAMQSGKDIRILVYGVDDLPIVSNAVCLGRLAQTRLAKVLGTEVDVFVDPSHVHSYGMPALEALASGVNVVAWDNLGIKEYFKYKKNLFEADANPIAVAKRVMEVLINEKTSTPKYDAPTREESVEQFISAVEDHFNARTTPRRIVVVVPHMRKHGGPTTIINLANELADRGHDVSLTSVYSDVNPEVTRMTSLPINLDAHNIPACEVLISNSDNPMNAVFANLPQAKHKIMLKLSHNARFKELEETGLKQSWDAVVTSTNWLVDVCKEPLEDWDHPPVEATRVGWWHYGHETMQCNPDSREYGNGENKPIHIATLIHAHPSKGTQDAILAMGAVAKKHGSKAVFTGVGEIAPSKFNAGLPNFKYVYSPNRANMAELLKTVDIWVGASHTEGLGRMALEAMSAGCATVLSDTGAEFAKDGFNCLLSPIGDQQMMAENIDRLITDEELAKKIRGEGFNTAFTASSSSKCIDNLEEVIDEICRKKE